MTLPRLPDDPDSLLAESGINIYAASGELLYTVNQRVSRVGLDEVHPHFIQAVLAIEDSDFYHHRGYSIKGMIGAFFNNIRHWGRVRGGSTLTQQIVKNIFLTREKFYVRKLKEILLATQLEALFEYHYGAGYKDRVARDLYQWQFLRCQCLWYCRCGADLFWQKCFAELTLLESAILAGLPNAPSVLNPFRKDQSRVLVRARLVLKPHAGFGFY